MTKGTQKKKDLKLTQHKKPSINLIYKLEGKMLKLNMMRMMKTNRKFFDTYCVSF